jgi:cytochrome d ubiquinol oxidase subunit II
MTLATFWFLLLAVLWAGFLVLDGFDFGVGALHGVLGRDEPGRRAAINTIGPLWDGNEVWLIVAGAGTFAAFPGWYATMFSALYLPLVLVLVALVLRGVAFEFRGKRDDARWRLAWSGALTAGSLAAPLLLGVGLGDLLAGLPVDSSGEFTGTVVDTLTPYGLAVGVTVLVLCLLLGATWLTLRTVDPVRDRAARLAARLGPVAALLVIGAAAATRANGGGGVALAAEVAAVAAAVTAAVAAWRRREATAFLAGAVAMAGLVASLFATLYPRVLVSSLDPASDLTVAGTASSSYSLTLMTVVVAVALPVVLAYQTWAYVVFRHRVTPAELGAAGRHPEPVKGRP